MLSRSSYSKYKGKDGKMPALQAISLSACHEHSAFLAIELEKAPHTWQSVTFISYTFKNMTTTVVILLSKGIRIH